MASKPKKATAADAAAKEPSGETVTTEPAAAETAPTLFTGYEQLADLGRDNFAAVLQANAALSEGLEAIGKEMFVYARSSFERYAEAATALLSAKTLEDVVHLQTEYATSSLERLIERSTRLSEMGIKVANEALAPLGGRVEATIQHLYKPAAA